MANPLILTEEEYIARQPEFAQYDKAYSEPCVSTIDPKAFTQRTRKIILEGLSDAAKDVAKKGEGGFAQAPVWGPTVKAEEAVSVYFKLVDVGTEDQCESTDGLRTNPPPFPFVTPSLDSYVVAATKVGISPSPDILNGTAFKAEPKPDLQRYLDEAKAQLALKLYRVTGLTEVTPEDINEEMGKRGRKNAKPAIYIRGTIVEPKLRVEI